MTDRPNYIALPHVVAPGTPRKAEHFNENFRAIADAVEAKLDEVDQRLPELSPLTGGNRIRSRGDGLKDAQRLPTEQLIKEASDLYDAAWAESKRSTQDYDAFMGFMKELDERS